MPKFATVPMHFAWFVSFVRWLLSNDHLNEEKFTVVVLVHSRPHGVNDIVKHYSNIPSVAMVVILWNRNDEDPSYFNINIDEMYSHFKKFKFHSCPSTLSSRFSPLPFVQTNGWLLSSTFIGLSIVSVAFLNEREITAGRG